MQHAKLSVGTHIVRLLVCESGLERLRGLLGRPELDPSIALLLDPCWAVHTFGMQHAIDVVFCDAQWRVLRTVEALRPRRAAWHRGATRVLELRARSARALGLVPGTRLAPGPHATPPASARAVVTSPTISPPVRALAGLAAITLCVLLLLGGCSVPRAAPTPSLDELRLQADIDYRSRAWSLAEADLRLLVQHEPRVAVHWRRLGVVLLHTGRAREAVESLEAAVRLGDPDPAVLQNLAIAHLRAACDRLDEASALATNTAPARVAGASPDPAATQFLRATADEVRRLLPQDLRGTRSVVAP